jgi:hypothetical protein
VSIGKRVTAMSSARAIEESKTKNIVEMEPRRANLDRQVRESMSTLSLAKSPRTSKDARLGMNAPKPPSAVSQNVEGYGGDIRRQSASRWDNCAED